MSAVREILVVGGTGMLRPAVYRLLSQGTQVILVARRPERIAPETSAEPLVRVAADWSDPENLAAAVGESTAGRLVPAALLWVHTPYDQGLHQAIDPLLSPTATVVQLWGSAGQDPRRSRPNPAQYRAPRSYRSLMLGFADGPSTTRWLTDQEISDGALRALNDPAEQQLVGRVEPWSDHP